MNISLLETEHISYVADSVAIVKDMSLKFEKRSFTAISGPSGSGKTTLLMILNGLITPSGGRVLYKGEDISSLRMPEYRSHVVLQFQEPLLFEGTGIENLFIPFSLEANRHNTPDEEMIEDALERCSLDKSFLEKDVSTFSGGEKQRLSLARSILMRPDALLLDEPTSALDKETESDIRDTLIELTAHMALIIVSHSQSLLSAADTTVRMCPEI